MKLQIPAFLSKGLNSALVAACLCSTIAPFYLSYADDVYLIIGQSNAAGRGALPTELVPLDGVEVFNDDNDFIPATPNLNQYSTIRKDRDGYNLGYTFGASMHHISRNDIKLVVNARGQTGISEWTEDDSAGYFKEAVDRVKDALRTPGTDLAGILWHQGEANRGSSSYPVRLARIIEDFRDAFDDPDLPFVAGQLSQLRDDNEDFNSNLLTLPSESRNTGVVTSENLTTDGDDSHFSTDALRELGDRYALEMLSVQGNPASRNDLPDHDFQEIADTFTPDVNATYYIKSLKGNLLAADANDNDVWAAEDNVTGSSVEWKFVPHEDTAHYHIDLAAGGTRPRLYTKNEENALLTKDRFSGSNTYWSMQEKAPGSDTYHITAVDEGNEKFKRLYLSPSAREASMTNTSKTGTWTTFEIIKK